MTRAQAIQLAQSEAKASNAAVNVWEHVGGTLPAAQASTASRVVLPQKRFITRPETKDQPRYVWRQVAIVAPDGTVTPC